MTPSFHALLRDAARCCIIGKEALQMPKYCVLKEGKLCDDCGRCTCAIWTEKVCDNCMRCLKRSKGDYAEIMIDAVYTTEDVPEEDRESL